MKQRTAPRVRARARGLSGRPHLSTGSGVARGLKSSRGRRRVAVAQRRRHRRPLTKRASERTCRSGSSRCSSWEGGGCDRRAQSEADRGRGGYSAGLCPSRFVSSVAAADAVAVAAATAAAAAAEEEDKRRCTQGTDRGRRSAPSQ